MAVVARSRRGVVVVVVLCRGRRGRRGFVSCRQYRPRPGRFLAKRDRYRTLPQVDSLDFGLVEYEGVVGRR